MNSKEKKQKVYKEIYELKEIIEEFVDFSDTEINGMSLERIIDKLQYYNEKHKELGYHTIILRKKDCWDYDDNVYTKFVMYGTREETQEERQKRIDQYKRTQEKEKQSKEKKKEEERKEYERLKKKFEKE